MNKDRQFDLALEVIRKAHGTGAVPISTPYVACKLATGAPITKWADMDDADEVTEQPRGRAQKSRARFSRIDAQKRTATFNMHARDVKAHGRPVKGRFVQADGLPTGQVTNVTAGTAGSVDCEMKFDDATWAKIGQGVFPGVSIESDNSGNSQMSLTDSLNDDSADLPKFERMLKGDTGEGRETAADVIKAIHNGGARRLDAQKVTKGGDFLDTRATVDTNQLRKNADRRQWLGAELVKTATDPLSAIKGIHLQGPRKMFI